jgi:hypothetical protein
VIYDTGRLNDTKAEADGGIPLLVGKAVEDGKDTGYVDGLGSKFADGKASRDSIV